MEQQEQIRTALLALFPETSIDDFLTSVEQTEMDVESLEEEGKTKEEQAPPPRELGVLDTNYGQCGACLDVLCLPDQVPDTARILDEHGLFLETITGVDWPEQDQIELLYDYNQMASPPCRVLVRTFVPRQNPVVPSIAAILPGADWHERETWDFFGVQFTGHPNLIRILLPEDADFHPLLKDYMP